MALQTSLLEKKNKLRRTLTQASRRIMRKPRIIASITSYPPRINTVHLAIQSLLAQKCLPDLIVLWLYKNDFPNREADLPWELRRRLSSDVCIRWVDYDLKPHKKYFWALQEYSDDLVITFDDDLIYPNTLIQELLTAYKSFPNCVISARTHLIAFSDTGGLLPYSEWKLEAPIDMPELLGNPSMRLFATSGAGTLFPPHSMPDETFNPQKIEELCLAADDVWLKCMQVVAGVKVVATTANQLLTYIPDTQEVALCHSNLDRGGNDIYLQHVLDYCSQLYPERNFLKELRD